MGFIVAEKIKITYVCPDCAKVSTEEIHPDRIHCFQNCDTGAHSAGVYVYCECGKSHDVAIHDEDPSSITNRTLERHGFWKATVKKV